ncbi:MAG: hypothetical protein DCC67_07615 [Planctomycetota bacterium]|nr:MAG: hypothetical protein DCC67_07615 [Planctomycetota bacterium]
MATADLAQPDRLNPTALPAADAARLLTAAGGQRVTAEMIQADVDAGALTNADGTINLIHYAAWLVREAVRLKTVRLFGAGENADLASANSLTAEQSNSLRAGGSHD